MRWLAISLAAAATATAAPAVAQSYGYGQQTYGYGSYGYSQQGYGSDFDWRRCHTNESPAACRNRLQQRRDTRYGDYRYDYHRDYPRDGVNYGYNSAYEYYADQRVYQPGYPYAGGSYGYPYGGYYGNSGSYRGYDSGASLALTVLGVALGVQILGSLDDQDHYYRNRDDRSWREWCRDRYRTFDWTSGTYVANDGYRRYCRRY